MNGVLYHVTRVAPVGRYGITPDRVERILADGLTWDQRNYIPHDAGTNGVAAEFNPEGVYAWDDLRHVRRLWPKSQVVVLAIDATGLDSEPDAWGGEGAWRITQPVSAERITLVGYYGPGEKP